MIKNNEELIIGWKSTGLLDYANEDNIDILASTLDECGKYLKGLESSPIDVMIFPIIARLISLKGLNKIDIPILYNQIKEDIINAGGYEYLCSIPDIDGEAHFALSFCENFKG